MFNFSTRSLNNLKGVHLELQRLMNESIKNSPYDFAITEGLRTATRQRELYGEGKSKTLLSRHLTGHAVDICIFIDGKLTWDGVYYDSVAEHILRKAVELDIPTVWGGTFRSLVDKVHLELNKKFYN